MKKFIQIFGNINYTKPVWLQKIFDHLKKNPEQTKKLLITLGSIVATVVVVVLAKGYYDNLPKPNAVTFRVGPIYNYDFVRPEPRALYITFSKSAASVDMIGKPITEGIKLNPEIKGQWIWASDKELKFTPLIEKGKLDWPVGQKFNGTFSKKILGPNIILEDYDFKFEIAAVSASGANSAFNQDPRFAENKKVIATFHFNYPVDPESVKKRLKLMEKSENGIESRSNLEFSVSFNEYKSSMYVQSANLKIANSNIIYRYVIEKGFTSLLGGESVAEADASIKVPSLYEYFKITNASVVIARNEKFESEQILRFENIAEIASEELFKSIEVFELPFLLDKNEKKSTAYPWVSASEVTEDVMKRSKKLTLTTIPSEQLVSLEHSYKFNSNPGRALYVRIPRETTSFGGFKLKDDFEKVITVPQYPSDLQIMGKGSLLPLTGSKQLSLVSRNLNKINYQIHQVRPEHVNHLIPALVYEFSKPDIYDIRPDRIAERFSGDIPLINKNPQKTQFSSINLGAYLTGSKKGLFLISVQSKDSAAYVDDRRFVILADLGLIVKKTVAGGYEVFVQNVSTGLPVAGAKVSVLGQNGINVLTLDTGANGSAEFPNLKDFKYDKEPIAFTAQYGDSISFVPFNSYSRELDLTSFDIGGARDSSESDQLNAYMFSDRGIYRPGEKADFGIIVRSKNWGKSFSQIPVDIVITNPTGQEVFKQTIKVSSNEIESVNFKTEDYFETGSYSIMAYIKQPDKSLVMIGSTVFQVEEFLPDQIKVRTTLSQTEVDGWVKPKDLKLNLTAFNLYGKPASERTARSKIRIKATDVYFKKWKDYYFNVPKPSQIEINDSLQDVKTNDNGEAEWKLSFDQLERSLYRLYVDSEVFETEGGKSVKSQLSQLISDQDYLLGYRSDLLDLSFIKKDAAAQIELLTVDSKLNGVAVNKIEVELIEKKPTSVLMKLPNETFAYQTVYKQTVLKTYKIETAAKATKFKLETAQVGEYILVFKDEQKTELNRLTFNVVGTADIERGLEKSSILKLGLNKKDYKANEEIEVQIKSPYVGAGLITIERDKVYARKWFKTNSKSTVEKIQIPAGLEGQAYIVVTMLRDAKSEEIYTSPLAYGAATFAIDLEARRSKVEITAPEVVKPGETLSFKVKAEHNTKAAIYLVDEGILQVANYKLPTPLNYFFQKKALQVNTYQILDLVMPDFNQVLSKAAGGDEGSNLGRSLNPFKRKNLPPVAHWVGVVDLTDKWSGFQYKVPDHFNGNLKVMVVAADDKKLGSDSVDVNVRGDFIINATATTFTAPDDEFEVNLIIANQLKGSGAEAQVEMNVESAAGFVILDKGAQNVTIPENKEKSFNIRLKATDKLGSHPITVTAGIGIKKAKVEIQVSNRPAVPYQQNIQWMIVQDKAFEIAVQNDKKPEFRKNFVQVHTSINDLVKPFAAFYEINDYLCSEQIASQLVPLALKSDKTKDEKQKIDKLVTLLRARQLTSGAFALYPGEGTPNWDVSLHLGMIFLYMQEKSEPIPEDMWKRFTQSLKTDYFETQSKTDLFRKAKAIYLLVRSQFIPKDDLKNMATLIKDKTAKKDFSPAAAQYLAASFKMAMQDDLSQKAVSLSQENKAVSIETNYIFPQSELFENFAITVKHFPDKANDVFSSKAFFSVIEQANKGQLNTYSASYLLMSLDSLMKSGSAAANIDKINFTAIDANVKKADIKGQKKFDLLETYKTLTIQNTGAPVLLSYVSGGFNKDETMKQNYQGIEISRSFENAEGKTTTSVSIGEEITVKIRTRVSRDDMSSIVITDLLPAGFEVVMDSVRKASDADTPGDEGGEEAGAPSDGEVEIEGEDGAYWPMRLLLNRAYAQTASISPMYTSLVDVREDRVNIYASISKDMVEYTYKIKAVSKGRFKVPGIYAKGLYRTDLIGQGDSGQIEVK
ncbi:MAG: MG2 domain-containing protein [Bdellovibrionota bacterium]